MLRTGNVDPQTWKRCIQGSAKFFSIGLEAKIKTPKTIVPVGWEKPPMGWMKLNLDGSTLGNSGRVGRGGKINTHPRWKLGAGLC